MYVNAQPRAVAQPILILWSLNSVSNLVPQSIASLEKVHCSPEAYAGYLPLFLVDSFLLRCGCYPFHRSEGTLPLPKTTTGFVVISLIKAGAGARTANACPKATFPPS